MPTQKSEGSIWGHQRMQAGPAGVAQEQVDTHTSGLEKICSTHDLVKRA